MRGKIYFLSNNIYGKKHSACKYGSGSSSGKSPSFEYFLMLMDAIHISRTNQSITLKVEEPKF